MSKLIVREDFTNMVEVWYTDTDQLRQAIIAYCGGDLE